MLTVENLRAWGANVEEALVRCLNNEGFYLKLVNNALLNPAFDKLTETVSAGDLEKGFDLAHSLKGVCANLALTPICAPVEQITELLRSRTETDYTALLEEISTKRRQLTDLM